RSLVTGHRSLSPPPVAAAKTTCHFSEAGPGGGCCHASAPRTHPHQAGGNAMRTRREAVIVATARTGLAKSFRGSFNLTRPDDMAAACVKEVLKKTPQLDPAEIDDVVMGTGFPEGPQGFNVGRNVAVMAGLPVSVPGQTVSRFCS